MPIYEFKCRACGYRFSEFFRTMHSSDEGIAPPCPRCHSTDTVRVVSSFAVHGPSQPDPQEVAAQKAYEERLATSGAGKLALEDIKVSFQLPGAYVEPVVIPFLQFSIDETLIYMWAEGLLHYRVLLQLVQCLL